MITVKAPAKINFTLEVLGKQPPGFYDWVFGLPGADPRYRPPPAYHEIRSVVQTVSLCDTLRIEASAADHFSGPPGWSAEKSLISRTLEIVRMFKGHHGGVTIEVDKRIPLTAGLGGDTSDAVAVLLGLDTLWRLRLPAKETESLAQSIGSDATFFLTGGTCLLEGRGEKVTPLPPVPHQWIIVVNPRVPRQPGKTGALYARLRSSHYTDGAITKRLVDDLREGRPIKPERLFNAFENVVFTRGDILNTYRSHILKMGAPHVHLCGSGPALFVLLEDREHADDLMRRMAYQDMEAHLMETINGLDCDGNVT